MRNVKILWGTIGLLFVCVLVLLSMVIRLQQPGEKTNPEEQVNDTLPPSTDRQDQIVASIGSRNITVEEVHKQLRERHGTEVLNLILDREAIRLEGEELGIEVSEQDILSEFQLMQSGYEDEEHFFTSMKEQLGLSKEQLREDVYYKLMLERIATRNIRVTDQQVEAYMAANPDQYGVVKKFHLWKIALATEEEAQFIVDQLASGEDFASLAEQYSLDRATGEYGGDSGWLDSDDPFTSPELIQAAEALALHEVSRPIRLEDGFAVIRVTGKREINRANDPQIRARVKKELALSQAVPLNDLIEQLRQKHNAVILDSSYQ